MDVSLKVGKKEPKKKRETIAPISHGSVLCSGKTALQIFGIFSGLY